MKAPDLWQIIKPEKAKMLDNKLDLKVSAAADMLIASKKLVIFTGAGVSTESGIPDFRSSGGIWTKFDPDDFTIQKFINDPKARKKHWDLIMNGGITADVEPNAAHYAIAELNMLGKLDSVITQNVDNLHQKAGVPDDIVLELHGNMQWVICLNCGKRYPFEQFIGLPDLSENIPDCEECNGILKPDAVFFGEQLPQHVLQEATLRSSTCDLFIVIGSSLSVYPAAYMPEYAKQAGAEMIIINIDPTLCDKYADLLIKSKAGIAMENILNKVKDKLQR